MSTLIGHNGGPTFQDIVRENLDRGLLIAIKEVIVEAVRDPRLHRRHLRVLAEVIDCINSSSGTAYPGRKTIAERTRKWNPADGDEDFGYSESGIGKTISELMQFGYLISVKKSPEGGGRAIAHYTIRKPSHEELQTTITAFIMAQRGQRPQPHPLAGKSRDVTFHGSVSDDVTARRDVTEAGNVNGGDITPRGNDRAAVVAEEGNVTYPCDVTSDVTSLIPTVTRGKELGERTDDAGATSFGARGGETHVGHGVFVNGETIRHPAFAISLPGISLATIASGLTATELKDRCLAHALQWAAEIEHGARPEKVLPSKISNFLARSIMGEVNQSRVTEVRIRKAAEPPPGRAVVGAAQAAVEPTTDRWARKATKLVGDQ